MAKKTYRKGSFPQAASVSKTIGTEKLRQHMRDSAPFKEIAVVQELAEAYHISEGQIYYHADRDAFYNERIGRFVLIHRRSFDEWFSRYFQTEGIYFNSETCYACGAALSTETSGN